MIDIRSAAEPASLEAARALIRAHFHANSTAHTAEETERVIAALPAPYLPPAGGLWVAWDDGEAAGCVALQPIADGVAELKRMYVRPEARRRGIARLLTEHAIAAARAMGYTTMRLGTLSTMTSAQQLYTGLGFTRIEPYRPIEFGDTWFYERSLV